MSEEVGAGRREEETADSVLSKVMELIDVSEATLRVMTSEDLSKPARLLFTTKSSLLSAPSLSPALRFAKDLEIFKREVALGTTYRTYKSLEEDVADLVVVMRGVMRKLLKSPGVEVDWMTTCLRVEGQVEDILSITDFPSNSHSHNLLHLLREQLRLLQQFLPSLLHPADSSSDPSVPVLLTVLSSIESKAQAAGLAVGLEKEETAESGEEGGLQQAVRIGDRVITLLGKIGARGEMLHLAEEGSGGNGAFQQVEALKIELEASEDQFKLLKERTIKAESDLVAVQEALAQSQTRLKATKQQLKAQAARVALRCLLTTHKGDMLRAWQQASILVPEPLPIPLPVVSEVPATDAALPDTVSPPTQEEIAAPQAMKAGSPALKPGAVAKPGAAKAGALSKPGTPVGKTGAASPALSKPGTPVGKPGTASPALPKPGTPLGKPGVASPALKPGTASPVPKSGTASPAPKAGATAPKPGVPSAKPGAAPKKAGKK